MKTACIAAAATEHHSRTDPTASLPCASQPITRAEPNDLRPQVGEDHLEEEHPDAVHVELVWVVEAPQDGGQESCHGERGRSGGLHTVNPLVQSP